MKHALTRKEIIDKGYGIALNLPEDEPFIPLSELREWINELRNLLGSLSHHSVDCNCDDCNYVATIHNKLKEMIR